MKTQNDSHVGAGVPVEPVLLDIRAAGALLGLTYWKVYRLVKARELPVVEIGGKFYFRRATLLRWVEKSEGKVAA